MCCGFCVYLFCLFVLNSGVFLYLTFQHSSAIPEKLMLEFGVKLHQIEFWKVKKIKLHKPMPLTFSFSAKKQPFLSLACSHRPISRVIKTDTGK